VSRPPLPPKIDPGVRKAESELAFEQNQAAQLTQRAEEAATIRHRRRQGMSLKRLREIYGSDLVDAVIGFDPES